MNVSKAHARWLTGPRLRQQSARVDGSGAGGAGERLHAQVNKMGET
eukprot:COSAG01_NODE_331_length_18718_cov_21.881358_12_plen_46_part_00